MTGNGSSPVGRPRTEPKDRIATAIRFAPDLHERLLLAADERDLSVNWLVNRAVADFLDRLLPLDQIVLTRDREPGK